MVARAELAPDPLARLVAFDTLAEGLDFAAKGRAGVAFFSSRGQPEHALSYAELREQAWALARNLAGLRLDRFARVAIIGETGAEFLTAFFACQYAGLIPMPLPINVGFGGQEAYQQRLQNMMHAGRAVMALGPHDVRPVLERAAAPLALQAVATVADLQELAPARRDPQPLGAGEPCYLQYSSGSTREPRGVMVTQRSLTHNARAIARHGLALRADDCATSWLPLYHDMGLVGFCLTPMLCQVPVHYLSPTAFARRPLVWLKVISEHGGTLAFSPTAGYELCLRSALRGFGHTLDLRHWRIAGIGGDMIRPDVLDRFGSFFSGAGFSPEAFLPSYGLAESTLAVSFAPRGAGVRRDQVDLDVLEARGHAVPARPRGARGRVRAFALCGRALPGHELTIRDENGAALPERRVGRIWVRGPSVVGTCADELGSDTRRDQWFDTGDLGYEVDGELVIAGRSKDLIISNGRNIWPQDLEWAVGEIEGVRSGAVAAFAVNDDAGREEVVVVVECRSGEVAERTRIRRTIAATLHEFAGIVCRTVLAAPHSLPFTSSGKLSRSAARALYLQGVIKDAAEAKSVA